MDQYYKILGLEVGANLSEIEVKYHLLMEEFNPDNQEDDLKNFFIGEQEKVKEAYNIIYDSLNLKKNTTDSDYEPIVDQNSNSTNSEKKLFSFKGRNQRILGGIVIIILFICLSFYLFNNSTTEIIEENQTSCEQLLDSCNAGDIYKCKQYYNSSYCDTVSGGDHGSMVGCVNGDCDDGFGTFIWKLKLNNKGDVSNKYIIQGRSKNRERNIRIHSSDMVIYVGQWKNRRCEGDGKVIFPDRYKKGLMYDGEWKYGKWNGYGVKKEDGKIFEGRFKNDQYIGPY